MNRTVTFLSACAGGALGAYLALVSMDRDPPVIVTRSSVITPFVPAGGLLKIEVEIFRYRRCETIVDRLIFDASDARYVLEPLIFQSSGGALGSERYLNLIQVPAAAAVGPARYRSIATYRCNLLHRSWPIVSEPRDVIFGVLPRVDR